jgi:acetyl esterase/lipase
MNRLATAGYSAVLIAGSAALVLSPIDGTSQEKARAVQKQPPKAKLPPGTTEHRDLRYGPHEERNVLDLYVPKSDSPLPLVVWIHGGAWRGGNKSPLNPAMRMLTQGYAVAAINYRLSQHAIFPAQIEDCKAAIRFLRGNARKYNLKPDAFGVWGSSAGGHLVALLGTSGDVKDLEGSVGDHDDVSSRVQAVCDFYGPTDLTRMNEQSKKKGPIDHDSPNSPESRLIGGPVQENKEKAAKANPIEYVTKDDPPFLIVHGDADPLVPLGQSEILLAALKKAGIESELVVIKDGGHGGKGFAAQETVEKIAKFFDSVLKK